MTRKQAAEYLQPIADSATLNNFADALHLAIEALRGDERRCEKLCYFSSPVGECKKPENVGCPLEVPVPVVKGKWEHMGDDWIDLWKCSACGEEWTFSYDPTSPDTRVNYCPNCGAKMGV
jgi:DNA-directed RNA polymerase subunit RPC12/RpoP